MPREDAAQDAARWIRPRRARDHFPPYELVDRDVVARTEARTR